MATNECYANDITIEFESDVDVSSIDVSSIDDSEKEDISTDIEVLSESKYEEEAGQNVTISSIGLPNWTTTPPQYGAAELDFIGPSGVNGDIVKDNDPLYLFELIFTDELIDHIVQMTNKSHALQHGNLVS